MNSIPPLRLSILIPTWNRVTTVLEAVESVGVASPDVEIIIVDNASDPEIFAELQRGLGSRSDIKLFRNEINLGMVRNWNSCMELAQGEWIGLLCSDDRYQPGAVSRLLVLVTEYCDPALIIQDPTIDKNEIVQICPPGSATVRALRLPIASGNFWHRRVYEQVGGFDERFEYSADAEYWYRAAFSFPVVKVRETFAVYVAHEDNYMWATWRRKDYLAQTELLARTVGGYLYADALDRENMIERHVTAALRQTVLSIISCSFFSKGKSDIFLKYFPVALQQARSPSQKLQLIAALLSAIVQRARHFLDR